MAEARRINKRDTLSQRLAYQRSALFVSLPFILVGGTLAALGFSGVELKGAHAPPWVIGAVGAAFLVAGVVLFGNALRSTRLAADRRARADAPAWERDYPWDPTGTRDRAGARVANGFVGAVLLGVFLAPFHWWAFLSGQGPWPVKIGIGLFDLVFLAVLGNAIYMLVQLAKYGHSRLRFARFPFLLGERLEVVFSPSRFAEVRFTLRLVEERYEMGGRREDRSTTLTCYELYREEKTLEPGALLAEVPVAFDLPSDPELQTRLGEQPIRYWELLVQAEEPGVDFETTFVLPVYAPAQVAVA